MVNLNETNQTAKHTPGPWMPPDGIKDNTVWATKEGRTELIATAEMNRWCNLFEANANARLIAAAPTMYEENIKLKELNSELLEACQKVLHDAQRQYDEARDQVEKVNAKHFITLVIAAITKATSTNPSNQSK